jgi:hypothetical protein
VSDGYEDQRARLNAALDRIPEDVKTEIAAAHRELEWGCDAASEGLTCCLDHLHSEGVGL